jgi:predicted ATPase
MVGSATYEASTILTPDQRLRIFVSSTLRELKQERSAAAEAIRSLRMTPVTFEAGARPHPPRDLYRSYLDQSHIFIGIYWESYGWIADDMDISGLEDELRLSEGKPRLIYVKEPAPNREPRLTSLLDEIAVSGVSYREFSTSEELRSLVAEDLAILLTESSGIFSRKVAETRPLSPLPTLPVPASTFVGREKELQQILDLLRDPDARLISLVGPGGIGKTRLALEVARRALDVFPDGVAFVSLDTIRDPEFILQAIASQLDVRDAEHDLLMESVSERLRDKRLLLVLDNFEHVLTGAGTASDLLATVPDVKILATSRALLELRGEHVVVVGPLAGPAAVPREARDAGRLSDAETLFVDRARSVSGTFKETPEDLAAVAEIVDTLDGVPLALELAAARLRALPAPAIAARLRDRLDILRRGPQDLPERQQTIRNTVQWSYDLLDDDERLLFRRLAVFAGGADLGAIEDVCGHGLADVLSTTGALVDKSLLVRVEAPTGDLRVRMLAIIREYAAEQLLEAAEDDDARGRHARYFLGFAERADADLFSADEASWLDALELDHENLRAAIRWFVEKEMADDALRLAAALRWFWYIRGHLSVGEYWLRRTLAVRSGSPVPRGRALVAAGALSIELGEVGRGSEFLEEALPLLEEEGSPADVAWAQSVMGSILQVRGRMDEAQRLHRAALASFDENDEPLGQCHASTALASIEWARGHYPVAEDYYRHSLEARRKLGDPWGTAYVLTALGWTRIFQHDAVEASRHLEEALPLFRKVRFRNGLGNAVNALGYVAADDGRWDETIARFEEALRLFKEVGNRPFVAIELSRLARAHLARRETQTAYDYLREACEVSRDMDDLGPWWFAVETLACLLSVAGSHVEAARLFGAVDCSRGQDDYVLTDQSLPLSRREFEQKTRAALGDDAGPRWEEGCALSDEELRVEVERDLLVG